MQHHDCVHAAAASDTYLMCGEAPNALHAAGLMHQSLVQSPVLPACSRPSLRCRWKAYTAPSSCCWHRCRLIAASQNQ